VSIADQTPDEWALVESALQRADESDADSAAAVLARALRRLRVELDGLRHESLHWRAGRLAASDATESFINRLNAETIAHAQTRDALYYEKAAHARTQSHLDDFMGAAAAKTVSGMYLEKLLHAVGELPATPTDPHDLGEYDMPVRYETIAQCHYAASKLRDYRKRETPENPDATLQNQTKSEA
jgi:hypothetical protein